MLARLTTHLGKRQAALEWKWINAAAPDERTRQDFVRRRCLGEPLQYILGMPFPVTVTPPHPSESAQVLSHLARSISWSAPQSSSPGQRPKIGLLGSQKHYAQPLKLPSLYWTLARAQAASPSFFVTSGLQAAYVPTALTSLLMRSA